MRWYISLLVIVFLVTLAVVVGVRASMEGNAFVMGAACGAAASLPASLLALWLVRSGEPASQPGEPDRRAAYPPVMIVNEGRQQRQPLLPEWPPRQQGEPQAAPRFRVIGEN